MAWHHIIPFTVLCEVWNRLVDQLIKTQLPEARTAIRQYLLLCGAKQSSLEALIDRIRAENTDQKRAGHHHLPPLDGGEALQLQTDAVWPPWNAVEGPRGEIRTDDPANRYLDRFTGGLTPQEAIRMRAIESLFAQLQVFLGAGPAPGAGSLRALAQAASTARPYLGQAPPIPYRDEMWVKDGAGWRKSR